MKLRLQRLRSEKDRTIGKLEVWKDDQWVYLCDTIESRTETENEASHPGRPHQYAIKPGEYKITMNVQSPMYLDYKKYAFARRFRAIMPRIIGADEVSIIKPGLFVIRGNDIMVGKLSDNNTLTIGRAIWEALMDLYFRPAKRAKEPITIQILQSE